LDFGGNADVSLKAGNKGASIEGEIYFGDVTVYTFDTRGLALQARGCNEFCVTAYHKLLY
jgi:hypothetical protein